MIMSEYTLPNGQVITINYNNDIWEVACWNNDETSHWFKAFKDEEEARKEFNRWRK